MANGSSRGAKLAGSASSSSLSLGALGDDGASLSAAIGEVTDAIARVDAMIAKVTPRGPVPPPRLLLLSDCRRT